MIAMFYQSLNIGLHCPILMVLLVSYTTRVAHFNRNINKVIIK